MMEQDNNRFLLLNTADDFSCRADSFAWDEARSAFGLVQRQRLRLSRPALKTALKAWQKAIAVARDDFGYLARISADGRHIEFARNWSDDPWKILEDEALNPLVAPAGRFNDLHLGGDDRLALTYSDGTQHGLLLFHLRKRWQVHVALAHRAERVWVDVHNHIWCAGGERLSLCLGEPLPHPYTPRRDHFEPVNSNPHPLRVAWTRDIWTTGETPAQLSDYRNGAATSPLLGLCADEHNLYALIWLRDTDTRKGYRQALLRRELTESRQQDFEIFYLDDHIPFVTDLGIVARGRLALQVPWVDKSPRTDFRLRDCPVVRLRRGDDTTQNRAELIYERYPQTTLHSARFVSSTDARLRYLSSSGPLGLHPLPLPAYPSAEENGWLETVIIKPLDAGQLHTLWHRLYIEAHIPRGCELRISVRTLDDMQAPYETRTFHVQHAPLWQRRASELPFDAGRLSPIDAEQGLYEILLQRSNGRVRELRGRYLQLRIGMRSDGRHTPRIHNIRVYLHPRSWQESWLPAHFHQQEDVDAAGETDIPTPANGADFRQRMLRSLEGLLTPIESRIISMETLMLPYAAPAEALPGMAALLGVELPAHWPQQRQRRWLASLGVLQRNKGTIAGLALALDIASDGDVARGRIVPVENYRLRRTRTTLLGIDMDDRAHPLTLGSGESGNSIIGDTLFLSEDEAWQFLALLAPEIAASDASQAQKVEHFFDQYAHRVTLLLHGEAREKRAIVEAIMREQMPAHVQWEIKESDHPFVLGLSPLLGIDTYLEIEPEGSRVRLGQSQLGRGDLLRNTSSFSPADVEILSAPTNTGAPS